MPKPDDNVSNNNSEEVITDVDADTRDVNESVSNAQTEQRDEYAELRNLLSRMDARMDAIESSIQSVKDAQSVVIDNGAIIRDDSPQDDDGDYVDTRTIAELDLSI